MFTIVLFKTLSGQVSVILLGSKDREIKLQILKMKILKLSNNIPPSDNKLQFNRSIRVQVHSEQLRFGGEELARIELLLGQRLRFAEHTHFAYADLD